VFPIEARAKIGLGMQAKPRLDGLFDARLVDHRQHAGKACIDEAHLAVRLGPEVGRGGGEQLGFGDDLGMELQAQHHFPRPLIAFDVVAHGQFPGRAVKPAAFSTVRATRRSVASSKARPMSCRPRGRPSAVSPAGTEIPGRPARLTGTVKTSLRYMAMGSSMRSPMANAAVGVAGVRMASTDSKARVKSRRIRLRRRWALR